MRRILIVGEAVMAPILVVLIVPWLISVFAFVQWRRGREGGADVLRDWAVQLYVKGTGAALLVAVAALAWALTQS
jgi:hypothetical protein